MSPFIATESAKPSAIPPRRVPEPHVTPDTCERCGGQGCDECRFCNCSRCNYVPEYVRESVKNWRPPC